MDPGDLLTRWTVRLAVALYLFSLLLRLRSRGRPRWLTVARLAWTSGCIAFLAHVVAAFHFTHHWSHAAALEATAERTADVVGRHWGGGLYANYAFVLVWLADAAWWWSGLDRYELRSPLVEWIVQAFLAFIVFNATVVFGAGPARWLGVVGCVLLGLAVFSDWAERHRGERRPPD
jgi:hypothetical protein